MRPNAMGEPAPQLDVLHAAALLQPGSQATPWPQRRALVKAVAQHVERSGPSDELTALLMVLAADPKWEVRSDVADCLMLLDADAFTKLAAGLGDDDNAFVRQAVERAMDRRRRGRECSQRKRRGLDHVQDQYATIEESHGSIAAQRAHAMAERLYDILVGATVHDMRNVLTPLKSMISSLKGHLADGRIEPRLFEKNLVKMGHQVEMIDRMLEDMRTYSQPTPSNRRRERLKDMVHEANGAVLDIFQATGRNVSPVTVEIDVPENLTVDVARFDMVRALVNLLKNAYESHATSPESFKPGTVWVTARPASNDRIEIIFQDDGMGLSPDELDNLRRFLPGSSSKKTYGTGFGLPTAKRKIEAHGGSLGIDSTEGKGTTIIVTIPVESGEKDE